jgi:hypothetical protein
MVILPAIALAGIGLTACDSKAGSAAVVNGSRISETSLNQYITPNAKPITGSDGSSTPARQFVLGALVRNEVFSRMLAVTPGGQPSKAELDKAKATVLSGTTEQSLTQNVTQSGLDATFTQQYLRELEQLTILQGRVTTQAQLTDTINKAKLDVSVSPRYGSWNTGSLAVQQLSKKQLPDVLTIDASLPGDPAPTASASP